MQIVPKEFLPFQHGNKSLEKSCTGEKAPKYGASCGKRNCYPQGLFEEARRNRSFNIKNHSQVNHKKECIGLRQYQCQSSLLPRSNKAEILWALKSTMSHFSYNSSHDIGDVFRAMLPDSKICPAVVLWCNQVFIPHHIWNCTLLQDYCLLSWTEAPCLFCHLMSPSIQSCSKSKWTLWWGTLYKVWWRRGTWLLPSWTYKSRRLKAKFEEAMSDLNVKKLAQVSMDGPHVNWKLLDMLEPGIGSSQDQYPDFLNVGSCSLHVVPWCFSQWNVEDKLGNRQCAQGTAQPFQWVSSQEGRFHQLTGTEAFPLPFCGHRWLENKQVAERALEIWPHITTYIRETLKKPKSQVPTSNTFKTVNSAVQDPLLRAKLAFFASTAGLMQPYLQVFQSDAPLLPFVTSDLQGLLETLMSKFVKQGELEESWNCIQACEAGCYSAINSSSTRDAECWICSKGHHLKNYWKRRSVICKHLSSRRIALQCWASTVAKIQERSPLKYRLGKEAGVCLEPQKMVSTPEEAVKLFPAVLQKLIHSGWKTSSQGWFHSVSVQKVCVWCKEAPPGAVLILQTQLHKTRLLMWHTEQGWRILRVVVHIADSADPLSQSGCCWKRFSVDKEVLAPNMQEMNLKSIRFVHSSVASLKIKTIRLHCDWQTFWNPVVMPWKQVQDVLDGEEGRKGKYWHGQKRKALQDELMAAKKKKTELESVASQLLDTANKKAKEAEKKSGVAAMKALIMESNASWEEQRKWRERTFQPKQEKSRTLKRIWRNWINSNWYSGIKEKKLKKLFMCGMINLGKYYELTKKGSLF